MAALSTCMCTWMCVLLCVGVWVCEHILLFIYRTTFLFCTWTQEALGCVLLTWRSNSCLGQKVITLKLILKVCARWMQQSRIKMMFSQRNSVFDKFSGKRIKLSFNKKDLNIQMNAWLIFCLSLSLSLVIQLKRLKSFTYFGWISRWSLHRGWVV